MSKYKEIKQQWEKGYVDVTTIPLLLKALEMCADLAASYSPLPSGTPSEEADFWITEAQSTYDKSSDQA